MIKIVYTETSIAITGHANYDVKGKDIVCAAVSGIYLGSLNWFKDNEIDAQAIKDGSKLTLLNPTKEAKNKIKLLLKQLKAIKGQYPDRITITKGK